jgi:hypothetical protein
MPTCTAVLTPNAAYKGDVSQPAPPITARQLSRVADSVELFAIGVAAAVAAVGLPI